jgi:hypothetical protein
VSQLIKLKPKQSVKMQAVDVPGFAVNEADPKDFLLHFEGHDKRAVFIMVQERILFDFFAQLKGYFERENK